MNKTYTAAERRYLEFVKSLRCLICARFPKLATGKPVEAHHIAEGSSQQNNWLIAPLCTEHHDSFRTGSGLHGMGVKKFVRLYKVPHDSEYGLLAWLNEEIERALGLKRAAA